MMLMTAPTKRVAHAQRHQPHCIARQALDAAIHIINMFPESGISASKLGLMMAWI